MELQLKNVNAYVRVCADPRMCGACIDGNVLLSSVCAFLFMCVGGKEGSERPDACSVFEDTPGQSTSVAYDL